MITLHLDRSTCIEVKFAVLVTASPPGRDADEILVLDPLGSDEVLEPNRRDCREESHSTRVESHSTRVEIHSQLSRGQVIQESKILVTERSKAPRGPRDQQSRLITEISDFRKTPWHPPRLFGEHGL